MVALFVVALLASAITGLGSYRYQRMALEKQAEKELSYLAQVQRDHLELWLSERVKDAEVTASDPFVNAEILRTAKAPVGDDTVLRERLQAIQNGYGFHAIRLVDSRARTLATTDLDPITPVERQAAVEMALSAPSRLVWDLAGQGQGAVVHVSCLVPTRGKVGGKPNGILIFQLDFQTMLVSILHNQPTFRGSGETLLVCRKGGQMVFLSRARLAKAPVFAVSLTAKEQVEVQDFLAGEGFSQGVDYRGVPSIAVFRKLTSLPWTILSKMDREEITAPLAKLALVYGGVSILFLSIIGILLHTWWRKDQAQHLADWEHVQREKDLLDQQLKALSRYANDIVLLMDGKGTLLDANDRALDAYGYTRDQILGLNVKDLRSAEALGDFAKQFQTEEYLDSVRFETIHVRKTGSPFPVEVSSRNFKQNGAIYIQSIIRDITERKQGEAALRESEAKFRGVVSQPLVGISIVEDGKFNYINPRFAEIFGYTTSEIQKLGMLDLATEEDQQLVAEQIRKRVSGEVDRIDYVFHGRRKEGVPVDIEAHGCTLDLAGRLLLISMVMDITERKQAEAKVLALQDLLREQSIRDGLTGLFNRRYLDETMDREVILAQRHARPISVVMGDLDHFKAVNDRYGHLAGDEVLRAFGEIMMRLSRKSDIYCRFGGEEFLLVLPGMSKGKACERAEQLRRQIEATPVLFGTTSIEVTASFGVACFPQDGGCRDELIAAADSALYAAKEAGRNQVKSFISAVT
jgi:diguanylate cyclase (GGDEF)-like protein/PAS domain S-box-containing protein